MAKNFGEAVREKREELGLKVYELANKVGVNPVYITQIEKHNKIPSIEVLEKIVDILLPSVKIFEFYRRAKEEEAAISLRKKTIYIENQLESLKKHSEKLLNETRKLKKNIKQ